MARPTYGELSDRDGRRVPVIHRKIPPRPAADVVPTAAINMRDELDRLSSRVRRLSIDSRNPEAFHVERSAIAGALQRLASTIR